ncbi:glutathione S-transferase N-terminal domain-containing protein [Roseobacter litoralis]|uniref:glutathione S-transferase N-terminal domain-containing protein n=1 Tax=Roseobacter litoralis TaxID=42443 RepID=UPI00249594D4|nr:glutathione S-transferase N-terminal domain-containing protein [Roseobacter litoralis]
MLVEQADRESEANGISTRGNKTMVDCKLAASKMSSYGLAARVVLEEKGVDYERIVIDPAEQGS